jgi:LytR cell envelope-related transcriptional attenuator
MTQPGGSSSGTQTGKAVLVIAVVIVVGWLVLAKSNTPTKAASTATTRHTTTTALAPAGPTTTLAPLVPPAQIKLQVLNGLLSGNLASEWSTKLKANPGYNTLPPDNATSKVVASQIYVITPGYQREANALAVAVALPVTAVNQTVPAPASAPIPAAERTTANLVLIIGSDLAGSA